MGNPLVCDVTLLLDAQTAVIRKLSMFDKQNNNKGLFPNLAIIQGSHHVLSANTCHILARLPHHRINVEWKATS